MGQFIEFRQTSLALHHNLPNPTPYLSHTPIKPTPSVGPVRRGSLRRHCITGFSPPVYLRFLFSVGGSLVSLRQPLHLWFLTAGASALPRTTK
ncbi:hypothetical protein ACOSQ2_000009 [Xanthoceras sorbifolium]